MEIIKNLDSEKLELQVKGRLDTTTAPELEEVIKGSLSGVKQLVLDFDELEYVSSAGLRVILGAQKAMNQQGEMKLINVSDEVMNVFEITGFVDILTIE
ncbi:MAG: STAS domain-containing protein [Clostridiales bacterium]|nr:STAS domain-containing protein [Candidatus Crickella caballi]